MLFNKQLNLHKPEEGIFGDCYRTCIACILNLVPEQVPNFADNFWEDTVGWDKATKAWLKSQGFSSMAIQYVGISLEQLLVELGESVPSLHLILTGKSANNIDHCVVIKEGKILWDPSLDNSGIVGEASTGGYFVEILVPHSSSTHGAIHG
jgi:hypothetical protein